jgi:BirA family transcriptional regulator, biotin operon repressor / biotin---[acetyl-CoA-carboxylase] ligase
MARLRRHEYGPAWVMARVQSQGVGRMGRQWSGLSGNLMASWYGVFDLDLRFISQVSFVTALALSDCLRPLVYEASRLKIKWPNDLFYGASKLSGILVQTETLENGRLGVVIGIGLNIAEAPALDYLTTALDYISDHRFKAEDFIERLNPYLDQKLKLWKQDGFLTLAKAWYEQAYGREGPCLLNGTEPVIIKGLDEFGALKVVRSDGQVLTLTNETITYG